ncbi:mycofactocin biosynthesis peptidyl-dipeptidase MftE [Dactylosporangium sp. AC04546]|uniref:mycofactocin biosynthesis peptidyl-dipeptidase MftE n=1 Tax=Dactylosporangium sp. AC04546 TaxID=2862460 RepID=UPI001EDF5343|nr:mycofactocin biosynthesis peptidyl-dipeptidase MftE [Dactylosporangium sp. AC04546]WVK86429.1 mycofactocin biosynthesis peptidyl-dipeptidase MftE [Dactylosporangium sp. AC04546]
MSAWVADLPWPVVRQRAAAGAILAVPLGSTEQHGPHLPLSTDTDIAVALCCRLAAARDDVLIAPPVPYGASDEHAGFAGTLSIGQNVLEHLVTRLVRSACETFGRVVLVSAHGGNAEAVTRAVDRLHAESRDVLLHMPHWEGEPHAGRTETAMVLSMRPERVSMADAVAGDTRPIGQLMPLLRTGGVRSVSPSGVLGDPAGATAAEGSLLLDTLAARLIKEVTSWPTGSRS